MCEGFEAVVAFQVPDIGNEVVAGRYQETLLGIELRVENVDVLLGARLVVQEVNTLVVVLLERLCWHRVHLLQNLGVRKLRQLLVQRDADVRSF